MEKLAQYFNSIMPVGQAKAEEIASNFTPVSYKKGEQLLRQEQVSNEFIFLEEGCIRSYLYDLEGNEVTMNFYGTLEPVIEVSSFFLRLPSEEYMETIADSKGCMITFPKLNELFHSVPEFREIGRAMLVRGFVQFKKRTLSMINKTAEERYAALMQNNPQVFQYASLKHIASYLGITDSSLSRIRREFTKK
jgi:CRP-like cAMP-binding protein